MVVLAGVGHREVQVNLGDERLGALARVVGAGGAGAGALKEALAKA
ncbi:hypothetical protein ABIB26_001856 [Arthrobacter sp. UYEF20]